MGPPALQINSPAEGTVVKAGTEGFLINVTANDDVGVKEFIVKVDGIVRDTINARENRVPSLRQNLRAMVFGTERRMITVVAKDNVDRTAERSFFVYSDGDPPTISNIRPLPNAPGNSYKTTASRVGISADILDRGMAGVKEVRLIDISETRIFDTRTRPYEGNRYILEAIRPSGTGTRIQQYYIQAFDKVGNMSRSDLITIVWEEPGVEKKKEPIIPKQPAVKPPAR